MPARVVLSCGRSGWRRPPARSSGTTPAGGCGKMKCRVRNSVAPRAGMLVVMAIDLLARGRWADRRLFGEVPVVVVARTILAIRAGDALVRCHRRLAWPIRDL